MLKRSNEKLDCLARVITPENIEFEYALAGPFQRLPAFLFDFAVRALVFIALLFVVGLLSSFLPMGGSLAMIVALLSFFALSWFYGIYFESRFNGRTLGKMLFKLRVISVDGRPINATQAALRNLLRLADMCIMLPLQIMDAEAPPAFVIPTLLIGLIVMTITPRMQRLGDLAAGTMVVSEYGRRSAWNLQPEDLRAFGLEELIPPTFQPSNSLSQAVGLYMENRKRLSSTRRNEVSKHLAEPLIRQFELLPDTSSDLLLCALYTRIFLSAEQREQGRQRMRESVRRPGSVGIQARREPPAPAAAAIPKTAETLVPPPLPAAQATAFNTASLTVAPGLMSGGEQDRADEAGPIEDASNPPAAQPPQRNQLEDN